MVAFENPDGTAVVVVANTDTYDSMLNLKVGEKVVSLRVLRESVSTVIL
ncbi:MULTISPECIES: glycoside hydrolase family 30 beta sandwich domain-containing protein [Caldicoprobacter]